MQTVLLQEHSESKWKLRPIFRRVRQKLYRRRFFTNKKQLETREFFNVSTPQ